MTERMANDGRRNHVEQKGCSYADQTIVQLNKNEIIPRKPPLWRQRFQEGMEEYGLEKSDLPDTRDVERGNDEVAFYLRDSDTDTDRLHEITCAVDAKYAMCSFCDNRGKLEDPRKYRDLFDHFVRIHYDRMAENHDPMKRVAYSLFQQLAKYEVNKMRRSGRRESLESGRKVDKRCEVVYVLNKDFGLPIRLITDLLSLKGTTKACRMSYRGMLLVKKEEPSWAKNL